MIEREPQHATIYLHVSRRAADSFDKDLFTQLAENLKKTTEFSHFSESVEVDVHLIVTNFSLNAPDLLIRVEWSVSSAQSEGVASGSLISLRDNLVKRLTWLENDNDCGWFLKQHSWRVHVFDSLGLASKVKPAEPPEQEWLSDG